MAEITEKLYYRKGGVSTAITLYDDTADLPSPTDFLAVRIGGSTAYAGLATVGDPNESDMRVRKGGTTYSVLLNSVTSDIPAGTYTESEFLTLVNTFISLGQTRTFPQVTATIGGATITEWDKIRRLSTPSGGAGGFTHRSEWKRNGTYHDITATDFLNNQHGRTGYESVIWVLNEGITFD